MQPTSPPAAQSPPSPAVPPAGPSLGFKLALIGSLYISQAVPIGFAKEALPVLLAANGASLRLIGMTSVVLLPWALKFLWAPRLDRSGAGRPGQRKAWLLPLQLLAFAGAGLLAWLDPVAAPVGVVLGLLIVNLLCATQDIAADALAVLLLRTRERGPGNSIQGAGYEIGLILGGGVLLVLSPWLGWQGMLWTMAGLLLLPVPLLLLFAEPAGVPNPDRSSIAMLRGFYRRPELPPGTMTRWMWAVVLLLLANVMALAMFRPLLVRLGLAVDQVGWLTGIGGIGASIVGSLAAGQWLRHASRWASLRLAAGLLPLATALLLLPLLGLAQMPVLATVLLLNKMTGGFAAVVLFTWMMDMTRPTHAGTDFTLQQSAFNISTIIGAIAAGQIAERIGFVAHFSLCVAIGLAVWLFLPRLVPTSNAIDRKDVADE